MGRFFVVALCLGCATASGAQAPSEGENLIVQIPPGFSLANQASDSNSAIEEYLPDGQTLDNWSEIITLQLYDDLGGTQPTAFLGRMGGLVSDACPGAQVGSVQPVAAGAYPAAVMVVICPNSPRTEGVESFAALALGGQDRLYVVQYAWDRRPGEQDLSRAEALFLDVQLCDTRSAAAPCPAQ